MRRHPMRRRRARENPLSQGEEIALGIGVVAVAGAIIYALSSKPVAASTAQATLIPGHRYSGTAPAGGNAPQDPTILQAGLDGQYPGVFKVITSTANGSNIVIVFDLLSAPSAAAVAYLQALTITDLGLTSSFPASP